MDLKQTFFGVVIFAVFWAFQAGYLNALGQHAWFVGAIIFSVLLWMIGKHVMPKASADMKELWMFATLFVVVITFMVSYLGQYLGAVAPAGGAAAMTPFVLSTWLIIYGAAMFVTGHQSKWGVTLATGLIWLVAGLHFVTSVGTGANSYLHFGALAGLPFIIYGLVTKR